MGSKRGQLGFFGWTCIRHFGRVGCVRRWHGDPWLDLLPLHDVPRDGLRSIFGRVSRTGAMTLSWTMDKVGPICRNVEDCALVFDAIRGADAFDQAAIDAPFNYDPARDLKKLKDTWPRMPY
jgi:hypothetical protein